MAREAAAHRLALQPPRTTDLRGPDATQGRTDEDHRQMGGASFKGARQGGHGELHFLECRVGYVSAGSEPRIRDFRSMASDARPARNRRGSQLESRALRRSWTRVHGVSTLMPSRSPAHPRHGSGLADGLDRRRPPQARDRRPSLLARHRALARASVLRPRPRRLAAWRLRSPSSAGRHHAPALPHHRLRFPYLEGAFVRFPVCP